MNKPSSSSDEMFLTAHPISHDLPVHLCPMGVCGYDLQVAMYKIESEIGVNTQKINTKIRSQGYVPVLVVDSLISLTEKAAYYAVSEAVVVTPVWDGMNLIPYESPCGMSQHVAEGYECRPTPPYRLLIMRKTERVCSQVTAKHGYFMRVPGDAEWKTCRWNNCVGEFGQEQAKDMLEHLEKVLANVLVVVEHGQDFVEIKPKLLYRFERDNGHRIYLKCMAESAECRFCVGIGDESTLTKMRWDGKFRGRAEWTGY
ncbi:probable alpha,alpha-trehalose-phosphate synthase [UDP-forming] 7 [Tanacetum coccineum]